MSSRPARLMRDGTIARVLPPPSVMDQHHVAVAKWSTILGAVAVATAMSLASRELRADRDTAAELLAQIDALARVNAELAEQRQADRDELAALQRRLLALEARAGAGSGTAPATRPGNSGPGTAPTAAEALLEFRKKVLAAIEPELGAIDSRLATTVSKADYDKHYHTFEQIGPQGYHKASFILSSCPSCLLPYMPGDDPGNQVTKATGGPRK